MICEKCEGFYGDLKDVSKKGCCDRCKEKSCRVSFGASNDSKSLFSYIK
jgi:hypothetical protein